MVKVIKKENEMYQSKLYIEDIDRVLKHIVGIEGLYNKNILVSFYKFN